MLANRIVGGWVLTERHFAQDTIAILYARRVGCIEGEALALEE
jgi:hypothetical protein